MDPIEKKISVMDEAGREYEATYPKRARGLVKKGRARFVDENTICLACPPAIQEDIDMTDLNHKNKADERQTEAKAAEAVRDESMRRTSEQDKRLTEAKATETVQDESTRRTSEQDERLTEAKATETVQDESTRRTSEQDERLTETKTAEAVQDEPAFTAPEQNGAGAGNGGISSLMKAVAARIRNSTPQDGPLLSVDYVLRQLEAVHQDDAHISRAMDTLKAMEDGSCGNPGSPGNLLGQAKASAIRDIAVQRESTNLELIKFYEKLYDDLQPRKPEPREIYELIERNRLSGMNDEALHAELMAVLRESL